MSDKKMNDNAYLGNSEGLPSTTPAPGSSRKAQPQIPKKFEFRTGRFVPTTERPKFVKEAHRRVREKANGTDAKKAKEMKHQFQNPAARPKSTPFTLPPSSNPKDLVDRTSDENVSDTPAAESQQNSYADRRDIPKPAAPNAPGMILCENYLKPSEDPKARCSIASPIIPVQRKSVEPSSSARLSPVHVQANASNTSGGSQNKLLNSRVLVAQHISGPRNPVNENVYQQPADRFSDFPPHSHRSNNGTGCMNAFPRHYEPNNRNGPRQVTPDFHRYPENHRQSRSQQIYRNPADFPVDRQRLPPYNHAEPGRPSPPPHRPFNQPHGKDNMFHHADEQQQRSEDYQPRKY